MVELVIERWSQRNRGDGFFWSVWSQGKRVGLGEMRASADVAEREGRAWCAKALGVAPDRVTHL